MKSILLRPFENPITQLSLIIILAFIAQSYSASIGLMEKYFVLQAPLIEHPWTVITSVFAHSGLNHLTSNLVGLVLFGAPVVWKASRLRFYLFFVFTGAMAGISQILISYYLYDLGLVPKSLGVIGASGVIFALLGYFITSNRISNFTSKYITISSKLRYLLYFGVAAWISLSTASPESALIGHFTGLIIGLVAGKRNLIKDGSVQ